MSGHTARPGPRVVAIGGGHGLSASLAALRHLDLAPTAVVTAADDGGSSGRLRRDLGIIAPGDLRMALLSLARDDDLADLWSHRFGAGELRGHSLGNLVLVALAERRDGFVGALEQAGRLLDVQGRVLPSTTEPVELHARCDDGVHLHGQVRVATSRRRIERIWLEPRRPPGCPESVAAILHADVVVLGPGSLFTSIVANLLVGDIAEALEATPARLVHVANTRTQPGETSGLDLDAHLRILREHLGRDLDTTIVHGGRIGGSAPAEPLTGPVTVEGAGEIVTADIVVRRPDGAPGDAHDPERLAGVLADLVVEAGAASPS